MSLDGFLTFLTIVIAAYAVMPTVTRLRIALRRGWLIVISIVGLVLVLYFEFYPLFASLCTQTLEKWCKALTFSEGGPISREQVAFAVVGVWLILASITISRTRLSPKSLPILTRLVSELLYQQRYGDIVELIDPQLPLLDKAALLKLKWGADRCRHRLQRREYKGQLAPRHDAGLSDRL